MASITANRNTASIIRPMARLAVEPGAGEISGMAARSTRSRQRAPAAPAIPRTAIRRTIPSNPDLLYAAAARRERQAGNWMAQQARKARLGRRLSWFLRHLPTIAPLALLLAALTVNAINPPFIRQLTAFTFDSLQRLKP